MVWMTLTVFVFLGVFLAYQGFDQQRRQSPGALDYLLYQNGRQVEDPLGIAGIGVSRLTCTGVSADKRIIGYSADLPPAQTVLEIGNRMRERGWALQSDSGQGVLTYTNDSLESDAANYVLMICSELEDGTAIVAELI
jgi:hypothetical protein